MPLNARAQSHASTRRSSARPRVTMAPSVTPRRATTATATTNATSATFTPVGAGRATTFSASKHKWSARASTRHNRGLTPSTTRPRKAREPRPVGDKTYVKQSVEKLGDFLRTEGFSGACTTQALARPTGRDFEDTATFLLRLLDASWRRDSGRKFDDEFVDVFKKLRYPFPISRTALAAVGTAHTWPPLLAALLWLVDLIEHDRKRTTTTSEGHVASRLQAHGADRVFYEYASDAYALFLAGDDQAGDALNARLEEAFVQREQDACSERETARAKRDASLAKIASLKNAAASLAKAVEDRSNAEGLRDRAALQADESERSLLHADASLAEKSAAAAAARLDAHRAQANVTATREAAATAQRDAPLVERLLRDLSRLEEQLSQRRRQRRASSEFKEISKVETSMRTCAQACVADARTYSRAALRLQLVPESAKNADGRDLRLDVGPVDAEALVEASRVASTIIAPRLNELKDAVAQRGSDVKQALEAATLQASGAQSAVEARRARLRDAVDDIKRLEERLARDRARADAARAAAGRDEDAFAAKADAARAQAALDQDALDALARRLDGSDERTAAEAAARLERRRARRAELARALDGAEAVAKRRLRMNAELRASCVTPPPPPFRGEVVEAL